jgi:hypothetical protein
MANTNKTNKAAEAVALLQKNFDNASEVLNTLPEDATEEQSAEAVKVFEEAKEALDKATAEPAKKENTVKEKKLKVKFLVAPAGRFLLPHNVGQIDSFSEAEANALVEAKYAEFVK